MHLTPRFGGLRRHATLGRTQRRDRPDRRTPLGAGRPHTAGPAEKHDGEAHATTLVTALVKPVEVQKLTAALRALGLRNMTVTKTMATAGRPHGELHCTTARSQHGRKMRLEILVRESEANDVVETIVTMTSLDTLVHVRTGATESTE